MIEREMLRERDRCKIIRVCPTRRSRERLKRREGEKQSKEKEEEGKRVMIATSFHHVDQLKEGT